MSIGKAIQAVIEARGLQPSEIADHLAGRIRATFYRILSGATGDPRLSTLVETCNALAISPRELLQLAGLLAVRGRPVALIDVELRQAFGELQGLNEDDKRLCLGVLRSLIEMRARPGGTRSRRRASPASREP